MKNVIVILSSLLFCFISLAQEVPVIRINDTTTIGVDKLIVETEIVNNIAITTYDMYFHNENDRTLEGTLSFPLGQGQRVTGFGIEVNGALREAVVVEKVLAQRAFENTVRQQIDPGLLEKTEGNNYRARIYPILPNAYKRVVLTYEKVLMGSRAYDYELLLGVNSTYSNLKWTVSVAGSSQPRFVNNGNKNYFFISNDNEYLFTLDEKDFTTDGNFIFSIPKEKNSQQLLTYQDYFSLNLSVSAAPKLRKKAKSITILWDTSLSVKERDINKELRLLASYLNYLSDVEVEVISFSNVIKNSIDFRIKNGDVSDLVSYLKNTPYDGGTSFTSLEELKLRSDEVLLFSDGLVNLGKGDVNNKIMYVINTLSKANHSLLEKVAIDHGGTYINLGRESTLQGLKALKFQQFQFLGISKSKGLYEIYPTQKQNVTGDLSLTGKIKSEYGVVVVNFGYGGKITKRIPVEVSKGGQQPLVKRIWAQQKLEALLEKAEIVVHAVEHQLITDYTSLIILDRVEDYVKYGIEPPLELIATYKMMQKETQAEKQREQEHLNSRREGLAGLYKNLVDWSKEMFEKPKAMAETSSESIFGGNPSQNANAGVNFDATLDSNLNIVSGNVSDESVPLPGANVFVQGTTRGTQADFDGNYRINVNPGQTLVFSYVGFQTRQVLVDNESVIDMVFPESGTLDEVIVTAQGIRRESRAVGYAVADGVEVSGTVYNQVASAPSQDGAASNSKKLDKRTRPSSNLKGWNPDMPYLKLLAKEETTKAAYSTYLDIRKAYENTPSFYMDVAIFFKYKNDIEKAVSVATNLLELDLGDYVLMRGLGYTLEGLGEDELAAFVYEKVLDLRPEEPQSYRDLALMYQRLGEGIKAKALLQKVVDGDLLAFDENDRFRGIESISYLELSQLDTASSLHNKAIDVRVVIDWNHNDTDIDLWVTDPSGEKAFYQHKQTAAGGRMSDDMTAGYGPESFLLKKALPGKYIVHAKYYANHQQKISGPTLLKATVFRNYGAENESREIIVTKLDETEAVLEIATFIVN